MNKYDLLSEADSILATMDVNELMVLLDKVELYISIRHRAELDKLESYTELKGKKILVDVIPSNSDD